MPKKSDFMECIKEQVLLADGALGTYLYEKGLDLGTNTDLINLTEPDLVYSVHEDYIRAGSKVIETNTFGANRFKLRAAGHENRGRDINLAGAELAVRAAGKEVFVAGSVGPTGVSFPLEPDDVAPSSLEEAFSEQIEALLEGGVDLLILETFTHLDELLIAIRAARRLSEDVPVAAQMLYPGQGLTAFGRDAVTCGLASLTAGANVIGTNCGRGVKAMLAAIERLSTLKDQAPLSAFPNAGFPEIVGHRTVYSTPPSYMAREIGKMVRLGARLIGGCCGTTPAHIHEFRKQLNLRRSSFVQAAGRADETTRPPEAKGKPATRGGLLDSLSFGRIPMLVELDPPAHLDVDGIIKGAKALADAGADAITLAEHPMAVLRADNLSLAHRIREEVGIQTVLHLTCRDRNVLGLQAQIMGAHVLGIEAILAVTGDPANLSDQPGVSGVFDVNSFGLARMINQFNHGLNMAGKPMKQRTNFSIGVAFHYRPLHPEVQIRRLERKVALGAHFVMTQPLFDLSTVEAMLGHTSHLNALIFPGIFPLISARNAEFLHNEIPGISIPARIREQLSQYEQVEDQRKVALELTTELMAAIAPMVDGLYLISPLNKWEVTTELVQEVRDAGWTGSGRAWNLEV